MKLPIETLKELRTPFYCYDLSLLRSTLKVINDEIKDYPFVVHYALKANANPVILSEIVKAGIGSDLVSGNEVLAALDAGFSASKMAYAGVGKTDWEIEAGIDNDIYCFNVESVPELEVINQLAKQAHTTANICLRINPNVGAHTHANIVTGLSDNKFGIDMAHMMNVIAMTQKMEHTQLIGLHFHIGSQIVEMDDFIALCNRINELQDGLDHQGIKLKIINVGGGLGIDYDNPDIHPLPDFKSFFAVSF